MSSTPINTEHEKFQLRPDIEWIAQANPGKWVARDPIASSFFYFSEIEYAAARWLNGANSLDQVLKQLNRRFPECGFQIAWLNTFIARLSTARLLSPVSPRVCQQLSVAKRPSFTQSWLKLVLSPLAIRIPLFDPSPWIERMTLPAAVLFHRFSVAVACVLASILGLSVLGRTLDDHYRIADALRNMQGDRWLLLLICYLIVKSLHELGHALASIRFGVACKEIGLLFLFFTPCLYCDTTDTWKLSSKWRRAAIAAAGMYVELWLATLAAAIWLTTHDGIIHSLAANVMVVCSVGTLFVNANPFLKYDGYYILSDIWGVPNLAEQSREATWSLVKSSLTGRPPETSHLDASIWSLAAYAIIASIYRTILTCVIMYIAWYTLVPYGLGFVAVNILIAFLFGMIVMWFRTVRAGYRELILAGTLRFSRMVLLFTVVLVSVALVCEVPVNSYIAARAVSDFADKTALFAPLSGELVWSTPIGHRIQQGSPILRIDAPDKQLELITIRGELALAQLNLNQLEQRSAIDETVAFEIPATREVIAELQVKEKLLVELLDSLTLVATHDGMLIPTTDPLPMPLSTPLDDRYYPSILDPSQRLSIP